MIKTPLGKTDLLLGCFDAFRSGLRPYRRASIVAVYRKPFSQIDASTEAKKRPIDGWAA